MKDLLIANPIYDIVFKHLMEDKEIAQAMLSALLEEQIVDLEMRPQETTIQLATSKLGIMRFDFKAEICLASGEHKKILIELQKVKHIFDVSRFRRYLGENYSEQEEPPLSIITVYFLGFKLDKIEAPIIRVNRQYQDIIQKKIITQKEKFIELLTHDSIVLQIPYLKASAQTQVEDLLQVFSPDFKTKNQHVLNFQGNQQNPIVQKMLNKLKKVRSEADIRRQMEWEDEIQRLFKTENDKLKLALQLAEEERKKADAAQKKAELERERAELERERAELERKKADAAQKKADAEALKTAQLLKELEELKKQIDKKND